MSKIIDAGRAKLRRLLMFGLAAAAALALAVGGMVAYSARVIDRLQTEAESQLVSRRVDRTLANLDEDLLSATVWNEADERVRAGDQAWMQVNFGDYYADYMKHDVTIAFAADGRLIYASRKSEAVAPEREAAFAAAVAPLAAEARATAKARFRPGASGLATVGVRRSVVLVDGEPYFVAVSTVVREIAPQGMAPETPVVASGVRAAAMVPDLSRDLGLSAPRLIADAGARPRPGVALKSEQGTILGWFAWKPASPGARLLLKATPALCLLLALCLAGLMAARAQARRLVEELADNEEALARSLENARGANAAKSQFLANMSHELRTPLNGVVAMTELLHARQTDPQCREMAQTILTSSRMLERVVGDVLDVSKIEAGQLAFESAPFDLAALVGQIVALHAAPARAKRVRLDLVVADEVRGFYQGDATRVGQIVSNLVGNAVKFTDAGAVCVYLKAGRRGVRIAVADSGIGFERAAAQRLFQRFEQIDASMSRRYGGAGLGLAICLALAQMMGGRLRVRSMPGRGSVFIVDLPLPRTAAAAEEPANESVRADYQGLNVLVADDHEVNRRVVAMALEPLGAALAFAENGQEALDIAQRRRFDLILMDVQMPVMDGLTATRRLRDLEQTTDRSPTPVIALTAHALAEDVVRSLDAGADLHMTKPIRPSALIEAVAQLLDGQGGTSGS